MWLLEEESEMCMMNILVSNVAITISTPMLAPARETVSFSPHPILIGFYTYLLYILYSYKIFKITILTNQLTGILNKGISS